MKKSSLVLTLLLFSVITLLAQRTITGTITDPNKEPLVGATVLVQGTSTGTASDGNGEFTLNVPASGTAIVVSYTGFTTAIIPLGSENNYAITLELEAAVLQYHLL